MIIFKCQKGAKKYVEPILEKLNSEKFLVAASGVTGFDELFTEPDDVTGKDILEQLIYKEPMVYIGFYTQNWFKYKIAPVNGYVPSGKNEIYLNTRQLWRSLNDIEETIWHELVHVSDGLNKKMVYWHGENNLKGKESTAPVKFAEWAANFNL